MKKVFGVLFFLCCSVSIWSQTKIGGIVVDEDNRPVPFANIIFKNSSEGTITNDNGRFYFESKNTYTAIVVSYVGYATQEIELTKKVNVGLNIVLVEGEQLDEVVVYTGKQSKKNNPAIDILRKIWAKKRENGLNKFKQYEYEKYEKIEFDLNTIDSAMMNSRLFKGMEFVFEDLDTSRITGKTYLPIFINEAFSKVYGDNKLNREREELIGNKNSGFDSNQSIIAFVQDLYADYDIYDNYLKFFDKSFVSPLSRGGIDIYNYVLADSTFIDNKWCYNIIYYPRRKNELTFKGDFWVNDSTYAVKEINMAITKSANINWVKEIYIEQEFDVVNDSVFLLKRDYLLTDFALRKKEKSRGIYGKRTTVFNNYEFDKEKPGSFYDKKVDVFDERTFDKDEEFWAKNRLEKLNKDEEGIYKLVDTLLTVPKFKRLYSVGTVLATGYYEIDKLNFDYGPVFSTFGANTVEGLRIRAGGRTFFSSNDQWRFEGYTAYGFRDRQFKYGISGKWLIDRKNRIIVSGGNRRDIEQIGVSLTATNDVLGRSFASSAVLTNGTNNTLTDINLSTFAIEFEPINNVIFKTGASFRTLSSAIPEEFSLDYLDPTSPTGISSEVKQFIVSTSVEFTPKKKTLGYGVERVNVNDDFGRFFINYSVGLRGFLESDFDFQKVQLFYRKPTQIGGLGRFLTTIELGRTFGEVPLALLSPVPGNQTFFSIFNTFPNLDFYEFVTDTYASVHLELNLGGRLFSRVPLLRKLDLREIIGVRGVLGDLSDENALLSSPTNIPLIAPDEQIYWEYSFGIGNIFKVFRIDFNFRGNYFEIPDARRFSVTGAFGFFF